MSRWTLRWGSVQLASQAGATGPEGGERVSDGQQLRHHLQDADSIATASPAYKLKPEKTHTDGTMQFARRHRTGLGLCLAQGQELPIGNGNRRRPKRAAGGW